MIPRNSILKRGLMHWYLKIKSKNLDNEVIQKLTCRIISNFISDDAKQQIKLQKKKDDK